MGERERMRRGEVIERRLRALVRQRVACDSVALALFSLAMAGALLLLVVSLFWSGWVMTLVLVPVGLLVWRLVVQNRFWNVARLVEEEFPKVRGKLVAAVQLAYWAGAKTGTVPRAERSGGLSPVFRRLSVQASLAFSAVLLSATVSVFSTAATRRRTSSGRLPTRTRRGFSWLTAASTVRSPASSVSSAGRKSKSCPTVCSPPTRCH